MSETQPSSPQHFANADLAGATFEHVDLTGSRLDGVDLVDVRIDGDVDGLVINGVDVGPLLEAELDRQHPERLHEQVDGEWSFIQTLRHRRVGSPRHRGRTQPVASDRPSVGRDARPGRHPRDREVRPSLDEALALRHDRAATVRRVVDELTDEQLASDTEPVDGEGWPPPKPFPVRQCLLIVLNEEWQHRRYAERDLDALLDA